MKLQDKEGLEIASVVKDVLEGKAVRKEKMDPTDHVKQKDGGFVVVDANGKEVKSFSKKDEADAYAIKNHDDLMAVKKEVAEPRPEGEKQFKKKHVIKKSGEKEDGTVTKEAASPEEKAQLGLKHAKEKEALKKKHDQEKERLAAQENVKEESKKEKYQKFFQAALKKFGVKSPAELDGDKKKEFFDYVDKNYEGDNEAD